jgi:hypothetical protein
LLCALASAVHADPSAPRAVPRQGLPGVVALLPLDADAKLEIFGQPVASEVARALVAGGLDVVVVGPKMAVPDRARVIVDGTIVAVGDGVKLVARIRDRETGKVLEAVPASADSLNSIDRAASELSSKVLPAVQHELAVLAAVDAAKPVESTTKPIATVAKAAPAPPIVLVALAPSKSPLHDALAGALDAWTQRGNHTLQLGAADVKAVAAAHAEIGIALDIESYYAEDIAIAGGKAPSAYARVRLRVTNGRKQVIDRVIATDTVLGDRARLAELVAREVLWIAEPRLRKVSTWH